MVAAGTIGEITFCHTFQSEATKRERYGNPPDGEPPAGLDWDMWLGPAPAVPFNLNRWGVRACRLSHFPLLLGLRRRRHDRLGRPPDRPPPPVLRRDNAQVRGGAGREILRAGQLRYARHHAGNFRISQVPGDLREPHVQSHAAVRPEPDRPARPYTAPKDDPGEPHGMLGDSQQGFETRGRHLGEHSGHAAHEPAALEELRRMHQNAAEAHQRHRNLRAVVVGVPAGQCLDARQNAPGLGREELDGARRKPPSHTSRRRTAAPGNWKFSVCGAVERQHETLESGGTRKRFYGAGPRRGPATPGIGRHR